MADDVSVWEHNSKTQVGTYVFPSIVSTGTGSIDIANNLGTDDIDIQLAVVGSLALTTGGSSVSAVAVAVDSTLVYQGTGAEPTVIAAPAAGGVRLQVKNNHTVTQDITVKYRLTARV